MDWATVSCRGVKRSLCAPRYRWNAESNDEEICPVIQRPASRAKWIIPDKETQSRHMWNIWKTVCSVSLSCVWTLHCQVSDSSCKALARRAFPLPLCEYWLIWEIMSTTWLENRINNLSTLPCILGGTNSPRLDLTSSWDSLKVNKSISFKSNDPKSKARRPGIFNSCLRNNRTGLNVYTALGGGGACACGLS